MFPSFKSYRSFAAAVMGSRRYIRSASQLAFLEEIWATSSARQERIPAGSILWRAQLGHGWQPYDFGGGVTEELEAPFQASRMMPLVDRARDGRANPAGIPHLYLATLEKTAENDPDPLPPSSNACPDMIESYRIVTDPAASVDADAASVADRVAQSPPGSRLGMRHPGVFDRATRSAELGVSTAVMEVLRSARPVFINTALDEMRAMSGSVDAYLDQEVGLTGEDRDRLHAELLH